jgi:hypothetical protein
MIVLDLRCGALRCGKSLTPTAPWYLYKMRVMSFDTYGAMRFGQDARYGF